MNAPRIAMLPDGRRLHLQHGPIDLIVEAFGAPHEIVAAYGQAAARFETVLAELVADLPQLRQPASHTPRRFGGTIAQAMEEAVAPHADVFITPMAAVAGAVADEVLGAMLNGRHLNRAYVNNGGDIALHLAPGQTIKAAIAGTEAAFADRLVISADESVRGIATSGWRGRSFSLGIADAVTVLAETAARADAAATIIANAVDLPGHPAIARGAANALAPDSDLGSRRVTVGVGLLSSDEIAEALDRGRQVALRLVRQGLIVGAGLFLHGGKRIVTGATGNVEHPSISHPNLLQEIHA